MLFTIRLKRNQLNRVLSTPATNTLTTYFAEVIPSAYSPCHCTLRVSSRAECPFHFGSLAAQHRIIRIHFHSGHDLVSSTYHFARGDETMRGVCCGGVLDSMELRYIPSALFFYVVLFKGSTYAVCVSEFELA